MTQKNRNNLIIACNYPLNPERSLSYASLPQGSSKTSNFRRAKVFNEITHSNNSSKEEDRDNFVNRVLTAIDVKCNEEFVNHTISKGYFAKQSPIMTAKCWSTMSEAANLRLM